RRFGLSYCWQLPPTRGVLSHECWRRGITAVGCEYLGAGQLSEPGASEYVAGILSCLARWGVCTDQKPLSPGGEVVAGDWMLASVDGVFHARRRLSDRVALGDPLAEIHGERGEILQCFTAQVHGRVLAMRSKAYIRRGDWAALIGSQQ